jgi:hypothetical protein
MPSRGRVPGCGLKARLEKIVFPGRGLLNVIKALRRCRGFCQRWDTLLMRSVMVSFRKSQLRFVDSQLPHQI